MMIVTVHAMSFPNDDVGGMLLFGALANEYVFMSAFDCDDWACWHTLHARDLG